MHPLYTIGELARVAGVPTSTVRYYERVGLLRPEGRSEGNYRLYGDAALERLRFIRAAQATGFTLDDVTFLLDHRHGASGCCQEVQLLMEERLSEVQTRMDDLRHVQSVLQAALAKCRETERAGHCNIIDRLNAVSSPSQGSGRRRRRNSGKSS
jgi:MerR family mercuric resistance operon transcriptional regulator